VSTVLNLWINILQLLISFVIYCFKYCSSSAELGALHVLEFSAALLDAQNAKQLFGAIVRCLTDVPVMSKHVAVGMT
jgi:hypothetical protein